MNTYENLIKQTKRYRAGFRTDFLILYILPVMFAAVLLLKIFTGSNYDFFDRIEAIIGCVFALLLFGGIFLMIRLIDGKGMSPKTVESDFEGMRVEAGVPDSESFNEMLEKMTCYEKFIFIDHRYFLDFRSLHVVPVRSIVKVEKNSVYHRRRTRYFIFVIADEPLKIACRNHRSQEDIFNALNLAVMEKEQMYNKGRSIPKAKWDTLQTSGDAEMDELNTNQEL